MHLLLTLTIEAERNITVGSRVEALSVVVHCPRPICEWLHYRQCKL